MRAAPDPRTLTGWSGASPHALQVSRRAFLRFPVCPPGSPLRPPSSGFPPSGVLRFVPLSRATRFRFPSGIPFPWASFTIALPAGGSAGVGPGRQGPRSPVPPRSPRLDRAIRPHDRWAAAGHDGMPSRHRLLRADASAGRRRARTARSGGSAPGCRRLADHFPWSSPGTGLVGAGLVFAERVTGRGVSAGT